VTAACPGFVRTRIAESIRNRPTRYGRAVKSDPAGLAGRFGAYQAERGQPGLDPKDVAAQVVTAVRKNELDISLIARLSGGTKCSNALTGSSARWILPPSTPATSRVLRRVAENGIATED